MKVVKLLDQASEDGPRGSLREQVGEHHDAGEVFDRDNATVDEIAKELGGAQDVLGLLEGNWVEGHADGGFAVSQLMMLAPSMENPRSISSSRMKITSLAASMAPKNSASALDSVTDRCILENQWKRHP
mgnify:CR=1 FL=1